MTEVNYTIVGSGIQADELKAFLHASYQPENVNIGDYQIDDELSGQRAKVWHNPVTNKTIIAHKGTQSISDWGTNAQLGMFGYTGGARFVHARKIQKEAIRRYGGDDADINVIGHSLGSRLASDTSRGDNRVRDVVVFQKPNLAMDFWQPPAKNETAIRTTWDPVSAMHGVQRSDRDVDIPSRSWSGLTEHKVDTLGRVDGSTYYGSGLGNRRKGRRGANGRFI